MAERTVRSPLPGTFYRRPSPDADPFVNEGDAVATGDVIGLVEVMKTFYELKADQDGEPGHVAGRNFAQVEYEQTAAGTQHADQMLAQRRRRGGVQVAVQRDDGVAGAPVGGHPHLGACRGRAIGSARGGHGAHW